MDSYHIEGGVPLEGEYRVKGAKNSALPILAATVCRPGVHQIYDCPKIGDVFVMQKILKSLGAVIFDEDNCLTVDTRNINENKISQELMKEMRSSVFLMGSLLKRCGEATIYKPGGCRIGQRPIDIHINGLEQMGFDVKNRGGEIYCCGNCKGGVIKLPKPSVGATENLMMAALCGENETVIENCACEPEIVDLASFLRTCGFEIYGAGTPELLIRGSKSTYKTDTEYFIMEDRIEAATYMMAAAATGGEVIFSNIRAEYLESVITVLKRMGAVVDSFRDLIRIVGPDTLKCAGIVVTGPFPDFPTDCQPQLLTLASCAQGITTIREEIFEGRFTHKKDLEKMGANIEICGKNAIIKGVRALKGNEVCALDLRGGAALVLAGLMAEGRTVVNGIEHILRGYEDLDKGLVRLGGRIERKTNEEKKKTDESVC